MTESLIPEWIREIKREQEDSAHEAERAHQDSIAATSVIKAKGLAFWKQLAKELKIAVDACESLGIRASLGDIGQDPRAPIRTSNEYGLRIEMAYGFPRVSRIYANLFYVDGSSCIRLYLMEQEEEKMDLAVTRSGEIELYCGTELLNAEQAAEGILKPMTMYVLGKTNHF